MATAQCDVERYERLSKLLPGVPPQTRRRWRTQGCRGVKLKAILRGGIWLSTAQHVQEFFKTINK
jgi:hypothetical protein